MADFDLSAIHCAGSSFGTDELEMVPHKTDITPKMVKAGSIVLLMYSPVEDDASNWAGDIYRAMELARTE